MSTLSPSSNYPFLLNNYDILHEIGSGNSASVYSIQHSSSSNSTTYACKVIPPNKLSATTKREILIHSSISHPNIINLHHITPICFPSTINHTNGLGLIMDNASQGDLFTQLISAGCLSSNYMRKRILEISQALNYLHQQHSILHLDIKLENIVIDENNHAKLIDFGCAKYLNTIRDTNFTLGGTLHYLSPEIISNPYHCSLSTSMDAWSLGVLFYTALTGIYPFSSNENQLTNEEEEEKLIKYKIIHSSPNPFPDAIYIPQDLKNIIFGLLQKNPADRMTIPQVIQIIQQSMISSINLRSNSRYQRRRFPSRYQSIHSSSLLSNSTNHNTTNRTRTPSPTSTTNVDFSTNNHHQIQKDTTISHAYRKQSKNEISTIIDFILTNNQHTSCNKQRNHRHLDNRQNEEDLKCRDNNENENEQLNHDDLFGDDDIFDNDIILNDQQLNRDNEISNKLGFPRVDSMMSSCSTSSHETCSFNNNNHNNGCKNV